MSVKLTHNSFILKLTKWEFWPIWLSYLPIVPVFLYYVLRSRRFFFFSNVNPSLKTGAFLGASKFQILNQIPDEFTPISILSKKGVNRYQYAIEEITKYQLSYPVIVKPDVGERGLLVELIKDQSELMDYLSANDIDIIIQEYIDLPEECGIFYIRKPSQIHGEIVSIGLKSFLSIKGDGISTLEELMNLDPRAKLQVKRFQNDQPKFLNKIFEKDAVVNLEPIGNHNRGTTFIDGNYLRNEQLNVLFDKINSSMKDVYYGRFDIKYKDWESLLKGKDLKILEMNGVASEPIHVYDEKVPMHEKYKSFFSLWKSIYEISIIQKARGYEPMASIAAVKTIRDYYKYVRSINLNWRKPKPSTSLT